MSEKPTAAFALSLVGGILILIGGLAYAAIGAICGSMTGAILGPIVPQAAIMGAIIFIYMALGVIFGIIVIIGAVMINKAEPKSVRNGSILVLVFSILSLVFSGGGFIIGFILGLVGGILGLVWKPSTEAAPAPPPPPGR